MGAALLNTGGTFERANAASCHMFGWSEEELKRMTSADITHPDIVMPGISRPDFVRQATVRYPTLKFIFMSGYLDHRLVASLGQDVDLLERPFLPAALLERVRNTLDR